MRVRLPTAQLERTTALLDRVRREAPLVQCLTNTVVQPFTANALLALGASPAMVDLPGEAGPFAGVADAVLVNLGTPHEEQRAAMVEAAAAASASMTAWVLDPVAVGLLPIRTALAADLVSRRPSIVRGNPSEVIALAGLGAGGRGTDSTVGGEDALEAAGLLATRQGCVVAISGEVDIVTDGSRVVRLANGHPWLTTLTGGGCALGGVLAAFAAAAGGPGDPGALFDATTAAVTCYTVAAEVAAERSTGPGSFAVNLLDALETLDGSALAARARLG